MKYLFVCGAGVDRSPTAAYLAREIAKERKLDVETHSLGLRDFLKSPITGYFDRYDKIFVMEVWMIDKIREAGYKRDISCLNIRDEYEGAETLLERILKSKLEGLIK